MSDENNSQIAQYLYDHPRMIGVLFVLTVLLTQVQPVLANCSGGVCSG